MADLPIRPNAGFLNLALATKMPGTGELVAAGAPPAFSGMAPTVTVIRRALVLTEQPVQVLLNNFLTPATGTLVAVGQGGAGQWKPTAGALALTGQPAAIAQSTVLAPNQGALKLTLPGPGVTPNTGALVLTGAAPVPSSPAVLTPSTAAMAFSGLPPSPAVPGSFALTPGTGAAWFGLTLERLPTTATLTLTGFAGSTLTDNRLSPPPAALVAATAAPIAINNSANFQPGGAALGLTGQGANLSGSFNPAPTALALVASAPLVSTDSSKTPSSAVLTLTGTSSSIVGNILTVPTGSLTLAGSAPVLSTLFFLQPATGALAATGTFPTVNGIQAASPSTAALGLTGQAPTLQRTGFVTLTPGAGALQAVGAPPPMFFEFFRAPGSGSLTLVGQAPLPATSTSFPIVSTGTLALVGAPPILVRSVSFGITPAAGEVGILAYAPSLFRTASLAPDTGTLTIVGVAGRIPGFTIAPNAGGLGAAGVPPVWFIDSGNREVYLGTGAVGFDGQTIGGRGEPPQLVFLVPTRPLTIAVKAGDNGYLGVIKKQPAESFLVGVDFKRWLRKGETVTMAAATAMNEQGTDSTGSVLTGSSLVSGTLVAMRWQGGVAGARHLVQYRVSTSLGGVWEAQLGLALEAEELVATFKKEPGETFVVGVDFDTWLATGETLATVTVQAHDATGAATSAAVLAGIPSVSGTQAAVRVFSGLDGSRHVTRFLVTTTTGNTYDAELAMVVDER